VIGADGLKRDCLEIDGAVHGINRQPSFLGYLAGYALVAAPSGSAHWKVPHFAAL